MLEIAPNCPPWLAGLAGFGLGAMTKQSLQRLRRLARTGLAPPKDRAE